MHVKTITRIKLTIGLLLCLNIIILEGQELQTICRLPEIVEETSGIEVVDGDIWTFNDSGGESEIYVCDTQGNLKRTVNIKKAKNQDWEDITQDDAGHIYIGDFGNNRNKRKDLTIYKIKSKKALTKDKVKQEKITFRFEDQKDFPPKANEMVYDCESVIWHAGSLYLFTKHRSFPMSTSIYKIPDQPGDYVAKKLDTFYTGEALKGEHRLYDYWVTAADISPDGRSIALLSGNKMWLITDFDGDDFFGGTIREISLGERTQKEAIAFKSNCEIYITDEYWGDTDKGRNLYLLNVEDIDR